jgi:hypothetical protein
VKEEDKMRTVPPNLEVLANRLDKLEKQNLRLKNVGLASLLFLGAVLLMAQTQKGKELVEAREFVLRDAAGKRLASLGTDQRHGMTVGAALRFFDSAGRLEAEFGFPDAVEAPALNLFSGDEKRRVRLDLRSLGIGPNGGSGVYVSLMTGTDGSAGLSIDTANDPSRVVLSLAPDGSPSIMLGDKTGKTLIGATSVGRTGDLAGKLRPTSSIALFGPNWEPLWEAPEDDHENVR